MKTDEYRQSIILFEELLRIRAVFQVQSGLEKELIKNDIDILRNVTECACAHCGQHHCAPNQDCTYECKSEPCDLCGEHPAAKGRTQRMCARCTVHRFQLITETLVKERDRLLVALSKVVQILNGSESPHWQRAGEIADQAINVSINTGVIETKRPMLTDKPVEPEPEPVESQI